MFFLQFLFISYFLFKNKLRNFGFSTKIWPRIQYTGCLNTICQTSNQHFFRTKLHSKQKPFIFGILSRGDLCMDNQFLGCLPCTASTASYLKDAIFLMIQWRKACLIFQAKMISLQLEWPIPFHSMVIASFWGQKYINSWDLTSEAVLRSSEATFQNVLKWFWLHFHTILISKWPRKGLHELSASLTSEADMEAAEAGLSKWLDFKAYA